MSAGAWVMMITAWTIVILFTVHFFLKVLLTPTQPEPDNPNNRTPDRILDTE